MLPEIRLSPSAIAVYKQCPLSYYVRYVLRAVEGTTPEAMRGTVVHRALELLYGLPRGQRTRDAAVGLLDAAWDELRAEAEPALTGMHRTGRYRWALSVVDAALAYFELEDPARMGAPVELEEKIVAPLEDGVVVVGVIDRLDVAGPDLRINDYKTGRAPRPEWEQKALYQMKVYAWLLWRTRGVLVRSVRLLYLGGDAPTVLSVPGPAEADLTRFEGNLRAVAAGLRRAHETGDWRAKPSKLCPWCPVYMAGCPVWPGDTPIPTTEVAQRLLS